MLLPIEDLYTEKITSSQQSVFLIQRQQTRIVETISLVTVTTVIVVVTIHIVVVTIHIVVVTIEIVTTTILDC